MSEDALVSVVIPAFNRAHCIGRAIRSVTNQTYPHIDIVVVDDGSTDGTAKAIQNSGSTRPLQIIQLDKNYGAPEARNRGIASAKGQYIAFLDSDDVWHPRKIAQQVETLRQRGLGFGVCYTGMATFDEKGTMSWLADGTDEGSVVHLLASYNSVGPTSSVLVRH